MGSNKDVHNIVEYISSLRNGTNNTIQFINNLSTCYDKFSEIFSDRPLSKSDELNLPLRRALFHIHELLFETLKDPCIHQIFLSQHEIKKIDNKRLTPKDNRYWEGFDSLGVAKEYANNWDNEIKDGQLRSFRCFSDFFSDRNSSFVLEVNESKPKIVLGGDLVIKRFNIPLHYNRQDDFYETIWAFSERVKNKLTDSSITTFYVLGIGSHEKTWPDDQLKINDVVNSIFIVFSGGNTANRLLRAASLLGSINARLLQALHSEALEKIKNQYALLEMDVEKSQAIERLLIKAEESFEMTRNNLSRLTNLASGHAQRMIRFADKFGKTLLNEGGEETYSFMGLSGEIIYGKANHILQTDDADEISKLNHDARALFRSCVSLSDIPDDFENYVFGHNIDNLERLLQLKNWLHKAFRNPSKPDKAPTFGTLALLSKMRVKVQTNDEKRSFIKSNCASGVWELFPNTRTFIPALLDVVLCWADKNKDITLSCTTDAHRNHCTFKTSIPDNVEFVVADLARSLSALVTHDINKDSFQLGNLRTAVKNLLMSANQRFVATVDIETKDRVVLSWHGNTKNNSLLKISIRFEKDKIDFVYPLFAHNI